MAKILSNYLYDLAKRYKKKNINVKIGCIGGSSFFYCHQLDKNTHYMIDKHYDSFKKKCIKRKEAYEYKLANLDQIYDEFIVNTLKNAKTNKRRNKKEFDEEKWVAKQLLKKEEERKRLPTLIKQLNYNIENAFLNREIKEIVDGICPDEEPCKIIYIKGYEKGNYWTLKEYADVEENKKKKD